MIRSDFEALQPGDLVRIKISNGIIKGRVIKTYQNVDIVQVRPNFSNRDIMVRFEKVELIDNSNHDKLYIVRYIVVKNQYNRML